MIAFVSMEQYVAFLRANPKREFQPDDFYACPLAQCLSEQAGRRISVTQWSYADASTHERADCPQWARDIQQYMLDGTEEDELLDGSDCLFLLEGMLGRPL